jgi:hypothetical protein
VAVKPLHCLCGSPLLGELDEGKSPGTTGNVIEGHRHLRHLAYLRKKFVEIVLRRIVAQIPNKKLRANNDLLPSRLSPVSLRNLTSSSKIDHTLTLFC